MLDFPQNRRSAAFIGADYTEYQPETMNGYFITYGEGVKEAERYATIEDAYSKACIAAEQVFFLSSVDNYASDVKRHPKQHRTE